MRDGFVRVAAGTPDIALCDPRANAVEIIRLMNEAASRSVKLLVLPELCLTGASCGDMFLQPALLDAAEEALGAVIGASAALDMLTLVGLPLRRGGALYNCAAAVKDGMLLAVIPKPGSSGAEARWFAEGRGEPTAVRWMGRDVPFGAGLTLRCETVAGFDVAVSIGGDAPCGAPCAVLACLSAYRELAGEPERARAMLAYLSGAQCAGYIMASAGSGESTTDMVYGGRRIIYENGKPVIESEPFEAGLTLTELDVSFLRARRAASGVGSGTGGVNINFAVRLDSLRLSRYISPSPFTPHDPAQRAARCEQILSIQTEGLAQRMRRSGCEVALLGVSGGLDSTLAMLVAARALVKLALPPANLRAITMPCFGTTDRTRRNAHELAGCLGSSLREINIAASVARHLEDIGHDMDTHDAAYENAQARERTQVLMDLANMEGGLVVGTGDMSELALGWATYNGDHMSMYSVNGGVPKTLIRHIVRHVADTAQDRKLAACLLDILDTPVSPELLPPKEGLIAQKTEELVGPYELHDFFLYHMLRRYAGPGKLLRLSAQAFEGVYDEAEIEKWLKIFLRRFFAQQFKRSCMPDGPMVGPLSLSPRGGLIMPSDASGDVFTKCPL